MLERYEQEEGENTLSYAALQEAIKCLDKCCQNCLFSDIHNIKEVLGYRFEAAGLDNLQNREQRAG